MMDPDKLKVGSKLYQVTYSNIRDRCDRHITGEEVIKINEKSIRLKRILVEGFGNAVGEEFTMSKEYFNREAERLFITLPAAIDSAIRKNKEHIGELRKLLKQVPKELPKMIEDSKKEIASLKKRKLVKAK